MSEKSDTPGKNNNEDVYLSVDKGVAFTRVKEQIYVRNVI